MDQLGDSVNLGDYG